MSRIAAPPSVGASGRRFFVARAPRVKERLEAAGWSATTRWDWDLYWRPHLPSTAAYASLRPGMRVNHIPGIGALTSSRLERATSRDVLAGVAEARQRVSRFVLIAGVDPLRVYVHGADDTPAVDRIIATAILAARDPMTRLVRDLVADRDACFELLRFDVCFDAERRPRLERCVFSPEISPAMADDALALLGIVPLQACTTQDLESQWREVAERELTHAGGFRRIVPSTAALAELPLPRRSDLVLSPPSTTTTVVPDAAHTFLDGKLVLFCEATQRFYAPNATASYVWLRLEEGAALDEIATELHRQFSVPLATARCDVWDIVARWAHEGLVRRDGALVEPPVPLTFDDAFRVEPGEEGGWIVRTSEGTTECRDEAEIAPLVRQHLLSTARRRGPHVAGIVGVAIASVVLVGPEAGGVGGIAVLLSVRGHTPTASGAVLIDERGAARPLALALEVSELDDRDVSSALSGFAALASWRLPSELTAKYVSFVPAPATTVSTLVFVRRSPSETPALRAIDSLAALQELTRHGMSSVPPMTNAAAIGFAEWLETTRCFELELGRDLAAAANAVEELLG